MLSFLFKPRTYPAFVLLAIMAVIAAVALIRTVPVLAWTCFATAAVLLISFARGVTIDLAIAKHGLQTFGRVTKIEHKNVMDHGRRDDVTWLYFTFTDSSGATHEQRMILEPPDNANFVVGSSVRIRYHPRYPEMWRWLE